MIPAVTPLDSAYLNRETSISFVINTAIGAMFYLIVFGGQEQVAFWGTHGIIVDCLPQGFMIGLMSSVVPSLIARARIDRGSLCGRTVTLPQLAGRGLLVAAASMLVLTAVTAAIVAALGATSIAFTFGLVLKALAGGILAIIATRLVLRSLFGLAHPTGVNGRAGPRQ